MKPLHQHILLIEPDRLLARSLGQAVAAAGYVVHWRADVQAALTVLDQNPVALIVLELQLARHNGLEFLYEVRSYPEWETIPVIVHTAVPQSSGLGNAKLWRQLGVVKHLYKPQTSLAQLVRAINRNLPAASQL